LISPVILIIDDVSDIIEEMTDMLELLDFPAIGATSIGAAIPLLVANPDIRLLICDLRLPGEDGAGIRKQIADHPALRNRHFGIIFMSGDAERVETMVAAPGQMIMTKPIDPPVLIDMVSNYLNIGQDSETTARSHRGAHFDDRR
jgi:CheY-like chemotaxis protein